MVLLPFLKTKKSFWATAVKQQQVKKTKNISLVMFNKNTT